MAGREDDRARTVRQHASMRSRSLVVTACLAAGSLLAGPGPSAAATSMQFDQRYAIAATLDVATGHLDAVVDVTLTNGSAIPIDHVNLAAVPRALGYFELDGPVRVDGEPVETEWTTSINLRVPRDGLPPRESATIRIGFSLDVGLSPDAFTARTSRANGVLSFGQWFPILSPEHEVYGIGDPQITRTAREISLDLATTAALPRDAVACPGLETAPDISGTRWTCRSERVRDFSFVVNPRFRLTERTVDGVDLRVYTEAVDGGPTADLAAEALVGLSDAFGDYSWPDLVLAEVGSGGGFSMEYPRMIHLTRGKVADRYVVYHEVAHQWFYAQLGNDQQHEPWLDEGFADFAARWLMGIDERQCSTRPVDSDVFAWPAGPVTGGDWSSCDGYFHTVFYRGTEFLNVIRAAMGDEAFFAAMRDWVVRHRYGFVTGEALLRHLQAATRVSLAPIYRAYLAHPPLPRRTPPIGVMPF